MGTIHVITELFTCLLSATMAGKFLEDRDVIDLVPVCPLPCLAQSAFDKQSSLDSGDGCMTLNTLKITELYTLKG